MLPTDRAPQEAEVLLPQPLQQRGTLPSAGVADAPPHRPASDTVTPRSEVTAGGGGAGAGVVVVTGRTVLTGPPPKITARKSDGIILVSVSGGGNGMSCYLMFLYSGDELKSYSCGLRSMIQSLPKLTERVQCQ